MFLENSILNKLKISSIILLIIACGESKQPLPIYGEKELNEKGEEVSPTISTFEFTNQSNEIITEDRFTNSVYIADFFFTTCKTICPNMTKQLARVQKELKGENFRILSHTVNPSYDTKDVLLAYSLKMNADLYNWDFVTGEAQKIYKQAASYQIVALKDTTVPIPFVHSEYLVLVDKKSRVRGLYDGTNTSEVNQLIRDTKWLIRH
jgi:protein SCO1/2